MPAVHDPLSVLSSHYHLFDICVCIFIDGRPFENDENHPSQQCIILVFSVPTSQQASLQASNMCFPETIVHPSTHITSSSSTYIQYFTQVYTKDASPNYGVSLGWSSHVFAFEFPMCSPDGGEQPSCVVLVNAGIKSVWPQPDRSQWGCQRQYLPLLGSLHRLQSEAKHIVCHALYIALYKTTACIDYITAEEVKSKYYVVHLMYDVHGFFCKSAITLKASQLTRLTAVSIHHVSCIVECKLYM